MDSTHDKPLRERLQCTAEAPGGAYKAAAITALEAVLDVHRPLSFYGFRPNCQGCFDDDAYWPCDTVRAVAEALGVDL